MKEIKVENLEVKNELEEKSDSDILRRFFKKEEEIKEELEEQKTRGGGEEDGRTLPFSLHTRTHTHLVSGYYIPV